MARPRPFRDVVNIPAPPPTSGNHGRKRVSARKRPRPETPTDVTAAPRRSLRVLQRTQCSEGSANSVTSTFTEEKPASSARPTKRRKPEKAEASSPPSSPEQTEQPNEQKQQPDESCRAAEDEVIRLVLEHPALVSDDRRHGSGSVRTREVLVDWLMEVGAEYSARSATLALSVCYLDRVVAMLEIPLDDLQLVAVTCMLIACKVEETEPPSIADVVFICDHLYNREQVLAMEETVLNLLGFRLTLPTHLSVAGLLAARVGEEVEEVVEFAVHMAMMDPYACRKGPGVVALGCVMAACWVAGVEEGEAEKAVGSALWRKWKGRATLFVERLFRTWRGVKSRHDADESRWILIRWADVHDRFGDVERRRNEARVEGMAEALARHRKKRVTSSLPR